jgi:hypothetical protein
MTQKKCHVMTHTSNTLISASASAPESGWIAGVGTAAMTVIDIAALMTADTLPLHMAAITRVAMAARQGNDSAQAFQ